MTLFGGARLADIETLYRTRFGHFVGVATSVTHDHELALEAVQEGFAKAVRSRRRFRGEGPLEAWVWRAVVNAALDGRSGRDEVADIEQRSNGHDPDAASAVMPLIAALPERQRLAIFLRYYADLDYRTIATVLDIEIGTVSATLSSAHASLRRTLREVAP